MLRDRIAMHAHHDRLRAQHAREVLDGLLALCALHADENDVASAASSVANTSRAFGTVRARSPFRPETVRPLDSSAS